jgi:hypothetical protein
VEGLRRRTIAVFDLDGTIFAALWWASQRWQRVRMTDWDRLHLEHVRWDLYGTEGEHQRSKRDVA